MWIDAAQIAAAQRRAVTVVEFENLDGDFAAVFNPVAKLCGGKPPIFCAARYIADDFDHFRRNRARKEMIMRNLIGAAHTGYPLQHAPKLGLRAPIVVARSRTRGGRNRALPSNCGSISRQSASSSSDSRVS